MKNKFLLVFLGFCFCVIVLRFCPPFFIKKPNEMNINDAHIAWLLTGNNFFIKKGPLLETNPELHKLNNPIESFTLHKSSGVYRIFCIGGSTTRGWPFQQYISYPKILSFTSKTFSLKEILK